tara:strand:+ start:347 stop:517 length:171 start_codon:yes stop_codon:yes gene_type:complete
MNNIKEVKNLINKDAGLEANIMSVLCFIWLLPLLLAYLLLKLAIIKPIKYLIGVKK